MTDFTTVQADPERDRWGRPLITPPGGGKAVAYTRCTTFVDVLEDKYNLQKWMQRMVAVGIGTRQDLHLSAASLAADPEGNKRSLDQLCEQAMEAAKASAKATIGTALHYYIEQINLGEEPSGIPGEFQPHVEAYRRIAASVLTPHLVERFTVNDELKIGGTPDLIAGIAGEEGRFVCDLKTGPATLTYGSLKVAMQMAVYAHSQLYDPLTGQRTPLDVRTDKGLVIALNSETAECTLHWIDLAAGWEAVQVAAQVRHWRSRKGLVSDYIAPAAPVTEQPKTAKEKNLRAALLDAIREAETYEALTDLWDRAQTHWDDGLTEAVKSRLKAIQA